jgi:hypothetical protein
MKMTLKKLLDRIPLFWILQTVGFCGYAIDRWIQGPQWFFPVGLGYIAVAFALTLCLRPIYHEVWERSPSVWKIGLIMVQLLLSSPLTWDKRAADIEPEICGETERQAELRSLWRNYANPRARLALQPANAVEEPMFDIDCRDHASLDGKE